MSYSKKIAAATVQNRTQVLLLSFISLSKTISSDFLSSCLFKKLAPQKNINKRKQQKF